MWLPSSARPPAAGLSGADAAATRLAGERLAAGRSGSDVRLRVLLGQPAANQATYVWLLGEASRPPRLTEGSVSATTPTIALN
jgi:hypothetical protein